MSVFRLNSFFERLYAQELGPWVLFTVSTTLTASFVLNVSDPGVKLVFFVLFIFWFTVGLFAIFGRGAAVRKKIAKVAQEYPQAAIIAVDAGRVGRQDGPHVASFRHGCLIFSSSKVEVCAFSSTPGRNVERIATIEIGDLERVVAFSSNRALVYPSIQLHVVNGDVIEVNPIKQRDPAWTAGATWGELRGVARRIRDVTGIEVESLCGPS